MVSVIIGLFLGQWLDGLWHTTPLFTVLGVLLGIGAGLYGIYQVARVLLK
ncbi:MAG: AtpZ/AtpI family protein [Firmicutes bacterium]|nr:AtpZ/AtpI family protein [Bacillota bacterium]MCL5015498.1 AtpZ/AtpI family protein [Bacillota bacterium]